MGDEDMSQDEFEEALARGEEVEVVGHLRVIVEDEPRFPGATHVMSKWSSAFAPVDPPLVRTGSMRSVLGARPPVATANRAPAEP